MWRAYEVEVMVWSTVKVEVKIIMWMECDAVEVIEYVAGWRWRVVKYVENRVCGRRMMVWSAVNVEVCG